MDPGTPKKVPIPGKNFSDAFPGLPLFPSRKEDYPVPQAKEDSMQQNQKDSSVANDVLQNPEHSKLTQEEIDKALAHHNKRHHPEEQKAGAPPKQGKGAKQSAAKAK